MLVRDEEFSTTEHSKQSPSSASQAAWSSEGILQLVGNTKKASLEEVRSKPARLTVVVSINFGHEDFAEPFLAEMPLQ
jgi:hypothetical protein